MADILLDKRNRAELASYLKKPGHAVLLIAPPGYGKYTIARQIAEHLLNLNSQDLDRYPYFSHIEPDNGLIGIDKIRELRKVFLLKTTGSGSIRRVVIIENADLMNEEAQNATLKILEEPSEDSVVILTVSNERRLRATVTSRAQAIKLHKIGVEEVTKYFVALGYSANDIQKQYLFTGGLVGLIRSLLEGGQSNEFVGYIKDAKHLLTANLAERLTLVDELSKDKSSIEDRLYSLKQVSKNALSLALQKNDMKLVGHWIEVLRVLHSTENNFANGANPKLLLTNLMLNL